MVFGDAVTSVLRCAAEQLPGDAPLTTGRVFSVLSQLDAGSGWERLWLHAGDPAGLHLAGVRDNLAGQGASLWENVPLSSDMQNALSALRTMSEHYHLPESRALFALALVADPDGGAARTLCRSGLPHPELLDVVQDNLVGVHLEGLADLLPKIAREATTDGSAEPRTAAEVLRLARLQAAGRHADEIDVLEVLAVSAATRPVAERLGLSQTVIAEFRDSVRAMGVRHAEQLAVDGVKDDESPFDLFARLGDDPSQGLSWLYRTLRIQGGDVTTEAMDAAVSVTGRRRETTTGMLVFGILNVLLGLVIAVLVLVHAVGPGSLWELFVIPFIWVGYPRWPSWVPLLVIVPLALFVTPLAAGLQGALAVTDWLQARAERNALITRTGIVTSHAVARRASLRRKGLYRLAAARQRAAWVRAARLRLELDGTVEGSGRE